MSDTVIKVENLSKKYILSHQSQERYTALRDVMANGVKNLGRKLFSPKISNIKSKTETSEEFYALKDVSFEIKQGDRVGIIGRNGAGKSTLLKILSRITEPTSGKIEITGRVASLLEVGTGLHPELTGRENVFLNGAILGMSNRDASYKAAGNKKISLTIIAAQGNFGTHDLKHVFVPRWISPWASGGVIYFQECCHAS